MNSRASKKGTGTTRDLHRESLLRIPLVAHALADKRIPPVRRAIDCRWAYRGVIPRKVVGFNPFASSFLYGAHSKLADWLPQASGSARPHNAKDALVLEVWIAVHDYLHAWTYALIRRLRPQLGLGHAPIRAATFEDMVFAHLATEAAATVGLDYWYLATVDHDELVPLGSARRQFSTTYRERHIEEYRRGRPELTVQSPRFFEELSTFYCTGSFEGYNAQDLMESPRTYNWLNHEINYGEKQRQYIREWLSYLSGKPRPGAPAGRPVACGKRWQRQLLRDVADALWALVKEGRDTDISALPPGEAWQSAREGPVDGRFININRLDEKEMASLIEQPHERTAFRYLGNQFISQFDFGRFDQEKLPILFAVQESNDFRALHALMRREPKVPPVANEPRDLMLLA